MAHTTHASSRFAVALLALCVALIACDSHGATRRKSTRKKTAAATVTTADSPGTAGSLVRRSPWIILSELPNFTDGVWGNKNATPLDRSMQPVLKPEYAPVSNPADSAALSTTDGSCTPLGMPTVMLRPYPFEFVFEPGRVLMLLELDGLVRRIYTDGRSHPDDPDLTYGGHSIGHWEKNTLVVDTVGILPEVQVAPGVPSHGMMHIVERMHLTNADTLMIETTVEAPTVLAKPWKYSMTYQRHRDWSIAEYFCQQNPRIVTDASGKTITDLTAPR